MHIIALVLVLLSGAAHAEVFPATFDRCAEHLPFGVPQIAIKVHVTPICHRGYALLHDDDLRIPRWVAYHLIGPATFGCIPRKNDFHQDENLPDGAKPTDYRKSGYDRGHQMPNSDNAWSAKRQHDSFSMGNMTPQTPHLNQWEWEVLEEHVRAWAWDRGELIVYVGPVIGLAPKLLNDRVGVPVASWKVLVDEDAEEAIGFLMPNKSIPKNNDLTPWQVPLSVIEEATGITFPLPEGIDKTAEPPMWEADIPAWAAKRKAMCE